MRFRDEEITTQEYIRILEKFVVDIGKDAYVDTIKADTGLPEERCFEMYDELEEIQKIVAEDRSRQNDLLQVAEAALDYIDAIPDSVAANFQTMPGFDREWANEVIRQSKK